MEILTCEQRTPEWYAARAGIPTASEFATVMAKGLGGGTSQTRRTYMLKLAGERLTGEPMDSYSNHHMERGQEMEDEARAIYSFITDADPESVGFIRNGSKGCSPDALVSDDGMVEIKTKLPHLMIDLILKNEFPPAHRAQCQGQLWVAEREWVDLVVYCPRLPLFLKSAHRDEDYIKTLAASVATFNEELEAMVEKVRAYESDAT